MPVYNCELYIKEAIDSILNQTFDDFEFLIIDDASTDETVTIIKTYSDSRIQLIEKEKNSGYTNSLNYGLSIAKGEYIARMDGDDISLPERFKKQVDFLEINPDIVVCGTLISIIGQNYLRPRPEYHDEIKVNLLFGNCIAHPSVMFRSSIFQSFNLSYDISREPAEDFALWVKLSNYGGLHNLQECLLQYRVHENQVSNSRSTKQRRIADEIRIDFLKTLNIELSELDKELLIKVFENEDVLNIKEIMRFTELRKKVLFANSVGVFNEMILTIKFNASESRALNKYFIKRKYFQPFVYWDYLCIKGKISKKYKVLDEFKLFVKSITFWKNEKFNE